MNTPLVLEEEIQHQHFQTLKFCLVCTILGAPDLASSCVDSRPDAKRLAHSYIRGFDKQSLPNTRYSLRKISAGFSPDFTRNLMTIRC
jgi:hypothetical protein